MECKMVFEERKNWLTGQRMQISGNILVTGANRGLGLALVRIFAEFDKVEKIFASCRIPEAAKELLKLSKIYSKIKIIKMDIQNDLSIQLAFKQIEFEIKDEGLNLLINNAGILEMNGSDFGSPNRSTYWRHFDVNSIGPVIVSRIMLPLLRKAAKTDDSSAIVNISSSVGSTSNIRSQNILSTGNIVYGMSKAALNHFTATLASMERQNNVLSISIAPFWTRTKIGGHNAPYSPDETARSLISVIANINLSDSGKIFDNAGRVLPF